MKIWQKHLFRKISSIFFFILFCLFAIYVLIDLSINGIRFTSGNAKITDISAYYIYNFTAHLDLFLPLSFLLASLKVFFDSLHHFEFLSLQMAGISMKKLLLPFFVFGTLLALLGLANHEWIAPKANRSAYAFKNAHSKKKNQTQKKLQTILLDDHSELVYHRFDPIKNELKDVFWIRPDKDLWHIKTLCLSEFPPLARFADHLAQEEGIWTKKESFEEKKIQQMPQIPTIEETPDIPFESRSLSSLFHDYPFNSKDQAIIRTHFHHKLAVPLLSLILLIGSAPFALVYSRQRPSFLIVSLSLFAFIAIMTLFDALLVLGENKVITPSIAMWFIPIFLLTLSIRRFAKL